MSKSIEPPQTDLFAKYDIPEGFKKDVSVVQVAMGQLGLLHRKTYNVLIANALRRLKDGQNRHSISLVALAEISGFDSHDTAHLLKIGKELNTTQVEYLDFSAAKKRKRKRNLGFTTLLSDFQLVENGIIEYEFSQSMAERLTDPQEYVWISLTQQTKFKGKYEQALFENCLKYIALGHTGFKGVDIWRKILGANEAAYDQFKHFNNLVIKPNVKSVNERSGIIVEPEFKRERRAVTEIGMKVSENSQLSLLDSVSHSEIRKLPEFQTAIEAEFPDAQVIYWIEKHGADRLSDALHVLSKTANPSNPAAVIQDCLSKGYGVRSNKERQADTLARGKAIADAEASKALAAKQRKLDTLQAQKAAIERAETAAFLAAIEEWQPKQSDELIDELYEAINAASGSENAKTFLIKDGLKSPLAMRHTKSVLRQQFPDLWESVDVIADRHGVASLDALRLEIEAICEDPKIQK